MVPRPPSHLRLKQPLTPGALQDLHCRYHRSGCVHLRNRLVEAHLNLVRQQAHRFSLRCSIDFDDLVQLGSLGLLQALQRFDPHRGHAFSTYAVPMIKGQMQHYLRDRHPLLRSPWRLRSLAKQRERLEQQRQHQGLPPLAEAEQAQQLGCSLERLRQATELQHALSIKSLDAPIDESPDAEALPLADGRPGPESNLLLRELDDLLQQLEPEDQLLLEALHHEGLSQRQLARRLGCSSCRISRRVQRLRQQLQLSFSAPVPWPAEPRSMSSSHSPPHC